MARLTKTDAARQLGIARSTLYKLIDQGKLSPSPDGLIDQAELVRVAAYADIFKERLRTSADTRDTSAYILMEDTHGRPQTGDRGQPETETYGRQQTSSDVLVDILREQIQILRDELHEARQAAQEREQDYREQIARLTTMLDQAHQQNQRLLDLPRPPPPSLRRPQAPRSPLAVRHVPRRNRTATPAGLCAGASWRCSGPSRGADAGRVAGPPGRRPQPR